MNDWRTHTVRDHSRRPILTFQVNGATGRERVAIGDGEPFEGSPAEVREVLDGFRRDNPLGLSADTLAIIDEFLKTKEATDGRTSVPPPHQGTA